MATDAEARARGFVTPAGTDAISAGDDAIRANARRTTDLWVAHDQLAGRVDTLVRDSGWRILPGSAQTNGWTMTLWCRRVGFTVELSVRGLDGTNATSNDLASLPTGLQASGPPGPVGIIRQGGTQVGLCEAAGGVLRLIGATALPTNATAQLLFTTQGVFPDPWPI